MKAILSRSYNKNETIGSLMIMDGERPLYKCKTIELPWLNNQRNHSCIPEGIYEVEKYTSPSRGECFRLKDVPGRDNILIHPGNFASGNRIDTKGCILPGVYFVDLNDDGTIDVAESVRAMTDLLDILSDNFELIIV